MSNATGLRWIGPEELLFSQMKKAPNMGVVTALRKTSANARDVYVPASATGMAHFSERSPDGSRVLVVEMERSGWLPCRLVPFDGSSIGRRVGPAPAECTAARWSPDGRWMYFVAGVKGESHLWRQLYPDGAPEQLTFGPNQERGTIAVDPDGKSLIVGVGAAQSIVWYHDEHGERSISIEGYAYRPLVSPDERKVFYLVRRTAETAAFVIGELWATDLASGRNQRLLPGFLIRSFQLSADGKLIVFDSVDESGHSGVWLATLDGREAPRRLTTERVVQDLHPFIGASGDIYFMQPRDGVSDLYRMRQDGSSRQRLAEDIDFLVNISPDEQWAVLWSFHGTRLIPLAGGPSRGLCPCGIGLIVPAPPGVSWSRDGTTIFVDVSSHVDTVGDWEGTVVIPWEDVGRLPGDSVPSMADFVKLPGARLIAVSGVAPGQTAARYAFSRRTEQSNLYRIRLP